MIANKSFVVAVSGRKEHGKTTLANILAKIMVDHGIPAKVIGFSDPMYAMAKQLTGDDDFSKYKTYDLGDGPLTGTQVLQRIGTECTRDVFGATVWNKRFAWSVENAGYPTFVFVPDHREPVERPVIDFGIYVIAEGVTTTQDTSHRNESNHQYLRDMANHVVHRSGDMYSVEPSVLVYLIIKAFLGKFTESLGMDESTLRSLFAISSGESAYAIALDDQQRVRTKSDGSTAGTAKSFTDCPSSPSSSTEVQVVDPERPEVSPSIPLEYRYKIVGDVIFFTNLTTPCGSDVPPDDQLVEWARNLPKLPLKGLEPYAGYRVGTVKSVLEIRGVSSQDLLPSDKDMIRYTNATNLWVPLMEDSPYSTVDGKRLRWVNPMNRAVLYKTWAVHAHVTGHWFAVSMEDLKIYDDPREIRPLVPGVEHPLAKRVVL